VAAFALWVAHGGAGAIEALLRASLAGEGVTDHERWSVGSVVPQLAALWWPRAGLVVSLGCGGLVVAWLLRRRSPRATGAALLATATVSALLAVELLAAPFLIVPLGLHGYYFVLDVDHRFPASHPPLGTNADGIRSSHEAESFAEADTNLLFLGDSFTYGLGVAEAEAFPARTAALLRERLGRVDVQAANFGWTSASPLLALRQLEDIGARYRPDVVIYALDMTDFHDDLKYRRMLERRGIYWWYDKTPIALRALELYAPRVFERLHDRFTGDLPRDRFFVAARPLEESRRFLQPLRANLERMAAVARGLGAEFVVVALPRAFQYSVEESPRNWEASEYSPLGPFALEPFRWLEEIAGGLSFPVLSLLPAFQSTTVFPTAQSDDPHWNAAGHQVAAEAIADFLEPGLRDPRAPGRRNGPPG
jgi:lysophospholipase L1-like esterase